MELALLASLLVLFGAWCTFHVALCFALIKKDRARAVAGFFLPPLAPYFGQVLGIKRWPSLWIVSGSLYFLTLIAGLI